MVVDDKRARETTVNFCDFVKEEGYEFGFGHADLFLGGLVAAGWRSGHCWWWGKVLI